MAWTPRTTGLVLAVTLLANTSIVYSYNNATQEDNIARITLAVLDTGEGHTKLHPADDG